MVAGKAQAAKYERNTSDTHLFTAPDTLSDVLVLILHSSQDLFDGGQLFLLGLLGQAVGTTSPHPSLQRLDGLLRPLDVLQPQLGLDDGHISGRIDITLNVNDLGVIERSDHLEDSIDRTDVRQESVSETSTGGSTSGQTGDIDTGEVGGNSGSGLVGLAEPVVSLIGDEDTSLLGVDSGIGEVGSVGERGLRAEMWTMSEAGQGCLIVDETDLGQQVEETRLSDVGYTDDTDLVGRRHQKTSVTLSCTLNLTKVRNSPSSCYPVDRATPSSRPHPSWI
jgi:hypothetical protein